MDFNTGLNDDLVIAANWDEEYKDPEKYKMFCMVNLINFLHHLLLVFN